MTVVSTRFEGGTAVVTLASPPVNMGNSVVRRELLAAIEQVAAEPGLTAVVLRSGLDDFYAGSDLREFDGELIEPQLPAVIAALEALPVPVIAAVTGHTLGGGLELVLGCDHRVASETARLGLPETTLGMLPGAGGTVRLARLVGEAAAIELVASGKPVTAARALELGLVDTVVPVAALDASALALAASAPGKRVLAQTPPVGSGTPTDAPDVLEAVDRARRRGRARPNVLEAVELVRSGLRTEGSTALAVERVAFQRLRVGEEARSLRYLFFAKRAAAKALRVTSDAAPVNSIGIAGAGTMGASIARAMLSAGCDVVLFDAQSEPLARAATALREAQLGGTLTVAASLEELGRCSLVVDAVFEDLDVKRELFGALDAVAEPGTVFASNTSYLDLDAIAAVLERPGRFAGLHFFNPADRNPLVEVIRTATSDERTLATLAALVRRLGKTGIAAHVGEGFVANRVYADYRAQAEFLLEDGAMPDQVDRAMTDFGFAMGPFAVGDLSGLDIAWARRKRLAATRDAAERYVTIPDTLCELGRLGKKTGAGYYSYDADRPRGVIDEVTRSVIERARAEKGVIARDIGDAEIVQRILCAMAAAAAEVVSAGVAAQASDVDVALTEGFAFPAWRGGPVRFVAGQPRGWVIEGLALVHASNPAAYRALAEAAEGELPERISAVLESVR